MDSGNDRVVADTPLLTVITAAYNAAQTVGDTIKSALALGPEVEIIVVDDGSTDSTADIVSSFGQAVRLIRQSNHGKSASRNTALEQAKGSYVLFLDADDMVLSNLLEEFQKARAVSPDADVFYGHYHKADQFGNVKSLQKVEELGENPLRTILIQNRFGILATICKASVVRSAGGFDLSLRSSEDWDLWIRLASCNAKFKRIDQPIAVYRVMPGSNSKDFSRMWQALSMIQRKHRGVIGSMKDGKRIFSGQIQHLLDRDLGNVYGDDLKAPWLKRRLNRTIVVMRLVRKCPGLLPIFLKRLARKITHVTHRTSSV